MVGHSCNVWHLIDTYIHNAQYKSKYSTVAKAMVASLLACTYKVRSTLLLNSKHTSLNLSHTIPSLTVQVMFKIKRSKSMHVNVVVNNDIL